MTHTLSSKPNKAHLKRLLQSNLVRNSGWLLTDKIARMLVGLVVSVLVARYLGPDAMGEWSFAISFVTFFSALAYLGFNSILPREFINDDSTEKIISTAMISRGLSSIVAVLASVLIMAAWKGWQSDYVIYVLILSSVFLFGAVDVFDYYFQSKLQSKYGVIARLSAYLLIALSKLYLIYIDAPLLWFILASLFEIGIAAAILTWLFVKKTSFSLQFKMDRALLKNYSPDILSLSISGMLIMIYMRVDQLMVTEMIGETANGIYSTGVRMVEILYFVPTIIVGSFLPSITYVRKHELHNYEAKLLQFYSIMTYAALGITVAVALSAHQVMDLLFGPEFLGSGLILFIYAFSFYSTFMGVATSQYLTVERLLKISLYRTFIGLIVNIILNLILIPKMGISGAAIASLISYTVATFSLLLFPDSRNQWQLLLKAFNFKYIRSL